MTSSPKPRRRPHSGLAAAVAVGVAGDVAAVAVGVAAVAVAVL